MSVDRPAATTRPGSGASSSAAARSGNWDPTTTGELVVAGPAGNGDLRRPDRTPDVRLQSTERGEVEHAGASATGCTTAEGHDDRALRRRAWDLDVGPADRARRPPSGAWQFPQHRPPTCRATPRPRCCGSATAATRTANNCQRPLSGEMLGIRRMALRVDDLAAPVVGGVVGSAGQRPAGAHAHDLGQRLRRRPRALPPDRLPSTGASPRPSRSRPRRRTAATSTPRTPTLTSSAPRRRCPTASTSRSFVLSAPADLRPAQVRVER